MKKVFNTAFAGILFLFFSCDIAPEEINYGTDACSFCKMTIVDQKHAAQYVTIKGKQFKFDAIECMVNDIAENGSQKVGIWLVADFENPGNMVKADNAYYLISKSIKSPMGANLSGFASEETAVSTQMEYGGKLYNWEELLKKFDSGK
ncbi:nitrous oxide reductase accessory protein NosL [Lutimonas zeaxanthinifaciens]|uniref:nitrous oxide reductase accessory protein NosL n=1 Tax=Lutimonas zeaxanthinifaciens TaxID=3060215 RepID=UPI00265D57FD|nr:nitrous oxide reductase accessory protein NosL [Lutimonas sp. YSD2104]WKK65553.1 nitrous oxide reductase accessory protein NosL [Lutimonas sp. YSD2104]